jgi:hypothetical protein
VKWAACSGRAGRGAQTLSVSRRWIQVLEKGSRRMRKCHTLRAAAARAKDAETARVNQALVRAANCVRSVRGVPAKRRWKSRPERGSSDQKKQTVVVPMQPVRPSQGVSTLNTAASRTEQQTRGNGEEQVRRASACPLNGQRRAILSHGDGGCHGAVEFRKSLVK